MADSGGEIIHCGPCEYENVTKMAAKWCSDCAEGYCDECLRLHKAAKMSRHHHLVPVSEYLKVGQMTIPQICQNHQKTYEYFCPGHDSVICILCVQSEHSKCQDLLSLQDAAKGAKTSTALNDLELNIDNLMENIENGLKFKDKNLSSILETEKSIKIAIESKHKEIIQYFERQLTKTLIELTEKYGHCQQEISSSKSTLLKKQTQLRNIKDRIFQMKTCLSDVQAFVGIKTMTENSNKEKEVVKSLVTDMPSLVLKFETNLKIQTSIENIEMYGTTTMATSKSCVTFVEPKVEQAQFKISHVKSVETIQLKLKNMINLEGVPCDIINCLILPNKQIMILDLNKAFLNIYNENGSHDRDISLPFPPFDATIIGRSKIVVTFTNKNIAIVDIASGRIERNIEIDVLNWCWGISHDNGKLYVVSYEEGINVLDLSGCIINNYPVDVENVYNLVTSAGNIIYSNDEGDLVCLGTDGSQSWVYSNSDLKHSTHSSSITADARGNVYVAGEQSNVIMAVSNNGKNQQIILTDKDGLENPSAIYYSKEYKLLLVCNRQNGQATVYEVCW